MPDNVVLGIQQVEDSVAGVVRPQFRRRGAFQDGANATARRLGGRRLHMPDRGKALRYCDRTRSLRPCKLPSDRAEPGTRGNGRNPGPMR